MREPGKEWVKDKGTESVRSLGGVWVLCEGRGQMHDGSPAFSVMTLGFDPLKARFVGSFIGSMMTYLWLYDGELDRGGKILTLDSEGPSFAGEGKLVKYRDMIEIRDEDNRRMTSRVLNDDGTWEEFMIAKYRRVK